MKIKKIVLPMVIAASTLALTSCFKDDYFFCKKGNGDITTVEKTVGSFSKIDIETSGEVFISQGSDYKVKIIASSNVQEYIEFDVSDNELELDKDLYQCFTDKDLEIHITTPNIEAIELSGSGTIKNTTPIVASNLKIDLNGSGEIELNNLKVQDYEVDLSGSGKVELDGTAASNGEIEISGSGSVDVRGVKTDDVEAEISGSGDIYTDVVNNLKVRITGSGDVHYEGSPSIDQKVTGSGNVNKL